MKAVTKTILYQEESGCTEQMQIYFLFKTGHLKPTEG